MTPTVIAMIGVAEAEFRGWIATLKEAGHVKADPAKLVAAIAAVVAELPSEGEPVAREPIAPEHALSAEIEVPEPAPAAASLVELPELGGAPAESPAAAWLDNAGSDDEGAEIIEVAPTRSAQAAAEAEAFAAPQAVKIGDVTLAPDLFAVLVDEAEGHLATLAHELSVLQLDSTQLPSAAMVRASHTLCGIHRTSGFPLIALTAGSLEQCLLALQRTVARLPESSLPVLSNAIGRLGELVTRVKSRAGFNAADSAKAAEIQAALDALKREATTEPGPIDAETQAAHEFVASEEVVDAIGRAAGIEAVVGGDTERVEAAAEPAPAAASTEPSADATPAAVAPTVAPPPVTAIEPQTESLHDALADIRDDVDDQVLPIFLEEAADLYPQAGAQVRGWRRSPGDADGARQLRRTLHTFKGSARMAGAMRLGELAHRMESRLSPGELHLPPSPELFEALDTDLDRIGHVLDALREGKANVALPDAVEAQPAAAASAPRPEAAAGAVAATPPGAERHVVVPLARPRRLRPRAPKSRPAPTRCCACVPTSSIGSSTRPAKWRLHARASKASCARSKRICSS